MGQSAIKNPRRVYSQQGGGGVDPALEARVEYLEQNEYKVTYFTEINGTTGTITKPTGSTILLDQFFGGIDAYVSTISNNQPTGDFPQTAGGVEVDVSSFDASGNFTLTGTPSSYPVALIYKLKIAAVNWQNLVTANILDMEDVNIITQSITNGDTTHAPSGDAVFDALALKASLTGVETLTNKRITKRVVTTTASATPTINTNNGDVFSITGQNANITSFTTNLSGSPNHGDMICIEITDNGTARTITWGASFAAAGTLALPTTTVISTLLRTLFMWDSTTSKWVVAATV